MTHGDNLAQYASTERASAGLTGIKAEEVSEPHVSKWERSMFQIKQRLPVSPTIIMFILAGALIPATADTVSASLDVKDGDQLAHTLCINCHVVDTHSPVIRTDRVPSFSWIANQEGVTAERIQGWLSTSHERMPDFTLTREEIRKLSAYILSLRK